MTITQGKYQLFMGITILLVSCTFTTTKTKDPVFTDNNKVQKELTSMVRAEHINVTGKQVTSNNKTMSELEVAITNATNIPNNDNERKALEKTIAASVKSNLKDPDAYDNYAVLFVTKETSGPVTKRNWVGDVFSSKEL